MSAGTGIRHSEHNLKDEPLRFIQVWINTAKMGITPRYGGFDGTTAAAQAARTNGLAQLVGDRRSEKASNVPVLIEQDCKMFATELEPGKSVSLQLAKGRQAYLICLEGSVALSDAGSGAVQLARHDAAEIRGEGEILLQAGSQRAHAMLLEMAAGSGGRGPGKWPMHLS